MPIRVLFALSIALALSCPALAAEEKKDKDKNTFVEIDTLTASLTAANGRHRVMTVQCGLDVADPALRTYATAAQPRLRDAYRQVVQLYAGGLPGGAAPDADAMARQLQAATDRVLHKPGARLLLGGVMVN